MSQITMYEMCIRNVARFIRSQDVEKKKVFDVFDASDVLAVAFCKSPDEVASDLVRVKVD